MSSKRFTSVDELSIDVSKPNQQLPDIVGLCLGSLKKNIYEVKQFSTWLRSSQENKDCAWGALKWCSVMGGEPRLFPGLNSGQSTGSYREGWKFLFCQTLVTAGFQRGASLLAPCDAAGLMQSHAAQYTPPAEGCSHIYSSQPCAREFECCCPRQPALEVNSHKYSRSSPCCLHWRLLFKRGSNSLQIAFLSCIYMVMGCSHRLLGKC